MTQVEKFVCVAGLNARLTIGLLEWMRTLSRRNPGVEITVVAGFGWIKAHPTTNPVAIHLRVVGGEKSMEDFVDSARSLDAEYAPLVSFDTCSVAHSQTSDIRQSALDRLNFEAAPSSR